MKKTRCIVIAACVLIASCMLIVCCGVFAQSHRLFVEPLRLFVEWMGYETLPLAQNSSIPAFVGEISDVQELRRIEFCWSDLEFRPMAGMPHTRVSYLSTNGKVVMVKLPITETEDHYQKFNPDGKNPIFITVLGKRQLYEHVVGEHSQFVSRK